MLNPGQFAGQRGMTLIELIIGLALAAILLGLVTPASQAWIQNTQIRTAAESVLNGLQLARAETLQRNRNMRFQLVTNLTNTCALSNTGTNWVISQNDPTEKCATAASDTVAPFIVQKRAGTEGSANATVSATRGGAAANTVTFDTLGRVVNATDIGQVDVTAARGDRPLRVVITPGGQIRMCDPEPTLAASNPQRC